MRDLPPLRNKGLRSVTVLTLAGIITLWRRYFWSDLGGCMPTDALIGIEGGMVSPGVREVCCIFAVNEDFAQAATDLRRVTGLSVGKERLRQIVHKEAQTATDARASGELPPAWTVEQAVTEPGGPTRVYAGTDGVMARMVTQQEKDKRRREHVVRRQQRGQTGVGNARPLPDPRPGHDLPFKEMKIGVFYNQGKSLVHAFATSGQADEAGRQLELHGRAIGFDRAKEKISLTDGAVWIRVRLLAIWRLVLNAMLLDFYHLSQRVWEAARCCLGEGEKAKAWAEQQLHDLKHVGPAPVLSAIDDLSKKMRAAAKRDSLRRLRNFLTERLEMLDYRTAQARGWDIGLGPTEAMCKNLTLRLKRTGMKWDADNAAGLMNLVALRESGQWDAYWASRQAA